MRELHVVALSEDGRHLVLATRAGTASGEFRVALDERLAAAVRGELPAPGRAAPPSISPRDIQARLRDGASPEQIAAAAGVPLSRVERYAGPVLAELERMITGARSGRVHRPRLGQSAVPLGEAVEAHLAEVAHLAEGSVRWSARRADLGRWVVTVSWTARGRRRTAGWQYDPVTREVVAVDGPSAVLGHVEADASAAIGAGRAARPAAPAPPLTARAAGRTGSAPSAPRSSAAAAGGRAVRAPAQTAPAPAGTSEAPAPSGPTATVTGRVTAAQAGSGAGPTKASTAKAGSAITPRAASPRATSPRPTTARPTTPGATTPRATTQRATTSRATTQRATTPRTTTERATTTRTAVTPADRPQPRQAVPRRSAVPPLDDRSAAPSEPTTAPTTAPPTAPSTPEHLPPGPPVLRVVPRAAPEQEPELAPAEPSRPARRAAGQRSSGRDWADVLMGGAPAPQAAEPRQDQPR